MRRKIISISWVVATLFAITVAWIMVGHDMIPNFQQTTLSEPRGINLSQTIWLGLSVAVTYLVIATCSSSLIRKIKGLKNQESFIQDINLNLKWAIAWGLIVVSLVNGSPVFGLIMGILGALVGLAIGSFGGFAIGILIGLIVVDMFRVK